MSPFVSLYQTWGSPKLDPSQPSDLTSCTLKDNILKRTHLAFHKPSYSSPAYHSPLTPLPPLGLYPRPGSLPSPGAHLLLEQVCAASNSLVFREANIYFVYLGARLVFTVTKALFMRGDQGRAHQHHLLAVTGSTS